MVKTPTSTLSTRPQRSAGARGSGPLLTLVLALLFVPWHAANGAPPESAPSSERTAQKAEKPVWKRYPAKKRRYAVYERFLHPHLAARMRQPVTDERARAFVRSRAAGLRLKGRALPVTVHTGSTVDVGSVSPNGARLVSVVDLPKSPALAEEIRRAFDVDERKYYFNAVLTTGITEDTHASRERGRTLYLPTSSLLVTVAAKNHRRVAAWTLVGDEWVKLWDVNPRRQRHLGRQQLLARIPDRRGTVHYGGYAAADLTARPVSGRWLPAAGKSETFTRPGPSPLKGGSSRTPFSLLDDLVRQTPQRQGQTSGMMIHTDAQVAVVNGRPIPLDNAGLSTVSAIDREAARRARMEQIQERLRQQAESARAREREIAEARAALEEARAAHEAASRNYGSAAANVCSCLPSQSLCYGCCAGEGAVALAVAGNLSAACHAGSDLCPWCHAGCGIASAIILAAIGTQTTACIVGCSTSSQDPCVASRQACDWAAEQSNTNCAAAEQARRQAEQQVQVQRERLRALEDAAAND